MVPFLVLFILVLYILCQKSRYDFKCFVLTLKGQTNRQKNFFASHDPSVPIEIIYGKNTKDIETAREFEDKINPKYFKKALEMHYRPSILKPNITYFNTGAIGCYFGHMSFYERCKEQGLKYAVIFEDNCVVKSNELYRQIQDVIDKKGDNFEMCFFHCWARLPYYERNFTEGEIERVKWISSTKCYLINVPNILRYVKYLLPMDNHIDMKTEDLIAKGARVFYKNLQNYLHIDTSGPSTIGHTQHDNQEFFSRQYPKITSADLKYGYV